MCSRINDVLPWSIVKEFDEMNEGRLNIEHSTDVFVQATSAYFLAAEVACRVCRRGAADWDTSCSSLAGASFIF